MMLAEGVFGGNGGETWGCVLDWGVYKKVEKQYCKPSTSINMTLKISFSTSFLIF